MNSYLYVLWYCLEHLPQFSEYTTLLGVPVLRSITASLRTSKRGVLWFYPTGFV